MNNTTRLILEFKVENIFKANDFEKEGQETKVGKWKLQGFNEMETQHGKQLKLFDVSIPDSFYPKYKEQVGKIVSVPVAVWVDNKTGKHGFFGVEN